MIGEAIVRANLKKAESNLEKGLMDSFLKIGETGVGYLKDETPVISGMLRNSMSYTIDGRVYSPLIKSSANVNKSSDKTTIYIGTNVDYAPSVEYLSDNNSKGFMHRAYKQTIQKADAIFSKIIKEGIG